MKVEFLNFLEDLKPGLSSSYTKRFTGGDVHHFAEATDDTNPVHLDDDFARTTPFGGRVVHGMLTASLISTVLAKQLPGPGCIYMSQTIRFAQPVRIGDEVVATVTVRSVDYERNRVVAETICRVGDVIVVQGEALFKAERRQAAPQSL